MKQNRLAIIGAGSSGLITLKQALDQLPNWEIICFDKSGATTGCWGNPYPEFVSTSTKYTTQFSCFRKWSCAVDPAARLSKGDFFRGDEYGRHLEDFVEHFNLSPHIRLRTGVERVSKDPNGWRILTDAGHEEIFDRLVICTGLAAKPKTLDTEIPCLHPSAPSLKNQRIVVLGGGESAADIAHRLAHPSLGNSVFLSLKSGIRVSPRYHPIRGVPSDFLRNRLMLSIHPHIRNAIGKKFVEARILHQELFEKLSNSKHVGDFKSAEAVAKRKHWDAKLTSRAKDKLFNTFHTKSDDFLDDVAHDRIRIIGPPVDGGYQRYHDFDRAKEIEVRLDALVPSIGFTAGVEEISLGQVRVCDFYLGVIHVEHEDLYLVGYARPIIGNIPTISEMQAKMAVGMIAGKYKRPVEVLDHHNADRTRVKNNFPRLNTETIYPVEMIPYCDRLARMMGTFPSLQRVGSFRRWAKIQLAPASTTHYLDEDFKAQETEEEKIHTPLIIVGVLITIWLVTLPYQLLADRDRD